MEGKIKKITEWKNMFFVDVETKDEKINAGASIAMIAGLKEEDVIYFELRETSTGKNAFVKIEKIPSVKEETIEANPKPKEAKVSTTNRNRKDIPAEFIVNIQGKEFITANGLLAIAEQEGGIKSIEILNTTINEEKKSAFTKIRVTMKDGRFFENYGSATPENLKQQMQKNYVEMSCTRAMARCIRLGLNVDYCSTEELNNEQP